MIVGVCGFIGSGKNTVAELLVSNYNFKRESFAASLKDTLSAVFGWDRALLEGDTPESRKWREQQDQWWSEKLGMEVIPRKMMQEWGTDLCRKSFHPDIWVASLENKLRNVDHNIVISDCRFPNEIQAIKNQGGIMVWVKRNPLPEWYQDALNCNAGQKKIGWAIGKHRLQSLGIHPSEYAWLGTDFDFIIDNDGTIDELCSKFKNLVSNLPDARATLEYAEFFGS